MNSHITFGNSSPVATAVGAGISVGINPDWDWQKYCLMATEAPIKEVVCRICEKQKSKNQVVCQVCYTNILDSRNGFYPDRVSKSAQPST